MRRKSWRLVSRRSCPSLNSNVHARPSVCVNRIRVRRHAGATWRRNAWWYRQPAGDAFAGQVLHYLESRDIALSPHPQGLETLYRLSRKKLPLSCHVVPIEISEKAIRQHGTATWKSAKPSNLRCLSAGCYWVYIYLKIEIIIYF